MLLSYKTEKELKGFTLQEIENEFNVVVEEIQERKI